MIETVLKAIGAGQQFLVTSHTRPDGDAIGSVLATHMWEMMQADPAEGDPNTRYYAALDQLSAESWRRDYGSSSGAE